MAFFTGEHECKLDAKGRLVLPSRLKSVLPEASKKSIIVRKGFESNLILYPITEFQNIYTRINSLNEFSSEQRKLKRNLFSGISQVDFDSNGRFLIPKNMISHCGIEKEVILRMNAAQNEQLNQYSNIYFNKIKQNTIINEK